MESLGQKLQQVRLRKKITLEEASRVTKIRTARIQEIEADDFSSFSSLAYAKGFLLIYGKFLDVNVAPFLDRFETSREISVDGYAYLQDAPSAPPPPVTRRQPAKRPGLLPLIIAVGVLVLGLYLVKLLLDIQRITPTNPTASAIISATPSFSAVPNATIAAPRALPVDGPPPGEAEVTDAPNSTLPPVASAPASTQPEIRRAQPVYPKDFASPNNAAAASNRVRITPMRKTFLRVTVDNQSQPAFDGWLEPADRPLSFSGRHVVVKVLERGAIQITKNGNSLAENDTDVTFQ